MENKKEFSPKDESTIRQEVITEYELDPNEEVNKKVIDKLTSERMETQKKISTAIAQKIKVREGKDFYKQVLADAKLDPKTGKPLEEKKQVQNEEEKFVTKEEFEKDKLRRQHSDLTDDEFEFVNAYAKGSGKSFRDALKTEIVKEHFETIEVQSRVAGATGDPSTRYKSSSASEEDKIASELDRDLPKGFSSKKK
jgi:hypothetical protein